MRRENETRENIIIRIKTNFTLGLAYVVVVARRVDVSNALFVGNRHVCAVLIINTTRLGLLDSFCENNLFYSRLHIACAGYSYPATATATTGRQYETARRR